MKGADVLLRSGALGRDGHAAAAALVTAGKRSEDALVEADVLEEAALLQGLSLAYRVHFVSTEKLSRLEVQKSTLQTIPRRVAELLCVFPVMFDAATGTLSVVTPDPDDQDMLGELRVLSGAKDVKAFVARPAAVRASIRKHHGGESFAFSDLLAPKVAAATYDSNVLLPTGRLAGRAASPSSPEPPPEAVAPPRIQRPRRELEAPNPLAPTTPVDGAASSSVQALLQVTATLVDGELRGHSVLVARLVKRMGEIRGLSPADCAALHSAGLAHDLGKAGDVHVTALSATLAQVQPTVGQAAHIPERLLENVTLPELTKQAVLYMYERWDGLGAPSRLAGTDIPQGARLLAVADAYADLVKSSENPYGRVLTASEAVTIVTKASGTIFDPDAAATLTQALRDASILERVHALYTGKRTGKLDLVGPDGRAEIWFLEGNVVHALCVTQASSGLELLGAPALHTALALREAEPTFDPKATPTQRSITEATLDLLTEASRRTR